MGNVHYNANRHVENSDSVNGQNQKVNQEVNQGASGSGAVHDPHPTQPQICQSKVEAGKHSFTPCYPDCKQEMVIPLLEIIKYEANHILEKKDDYDKLEENEWNVIYNTQYLKVKYRNLNDREPSFPHENFRAMIEEVNLPPQCLPKFFELLFKECVEEPEDVYAPEIYAIYLPHFNGISVTIGAKPGKYTELNMTNASFRSKVFQCKNIVSQFLIAKMSATHL